jgi:thymidylate kinase
MLVINLWGGPGAGKSTVAAEVFVKLRQRTKANVELTNEFATELCFEQAKENLKDQVYLLGNQWHRLWRLAHKGVDVAVCDSPIGMGSAYPHAEPYQEEYDALAAKLRFQYPTINILIDRDIYSEGGFKGNTKKRNINWLNQLDKKIAKAARTEMNVMFNRDSTGAEVAEYCIPRVRHYLVNGHMNHWGTS